MSTLDVQRSDLFGSMPWVCEPTDKSGARARNGAGGAGVGGVWKPLRVLVACEFSGAVRDAFARLGHDAVSCDLLPSETPVGVIHLGATAHYQCDVRELLQPDKWDVMIAHPPCTHLAVSGARWFAAKRSEQAEALQFVRDLLDAPVPRVALENPVSIISSKVRKPDQVIQPWQFGHGETKATCLWLKGLPKLTPTNIVAGREARVHRMPPGPNRWRERSRTFQGIAEAMAIQWGGGGAERRGDALATRSRAGSQTESSSGTGSAEPASTGEGARAPSLFPAAHGSANCKRRVRNEAEREEGRE